MKHIISALLLAIALPVMAQSSQCGPVEQMKTLLDQYGEEIVFRGARLDPSGNPTPVYLIISLNEKTGSWTVFSANPGNIACVLSAGERGEVVTPPPNKKPSAKDSKSI